MIKLLTGNTTLSFASVDLAKTNLTDGFLKVKVAYVKDNEGFLIEICSPME